MAGTMNAVQPCESPAQNLTVSSRTPAMLSTGRRRSAILLASTLLLVSVIVLRHVNLGEFNLNFDEAHHAATGLYFADLLSDLPLTHLLQYTYLYYAHYPVLGLTHWPPFFYLAEGVMFLILGPSVVAARLTVLLFALLGLVFWFTLIRELQDELAGAIATAALGLLPFFLLYEKAVMLEVPSLALCIGASHFWVKYLREAASRHLYWFAFLASLALLTKQHSIYLAPFCLLTVLALRKWRLILNRTTLKALGLVLLLTGPFYALAFKVQPHAALAVYQGNRPIAYPFAYYFTILPHQLGWTFLVLATIGLVTWRWWGKRESVVIMFMWIVACYVSFTWFALKEPRYILNWMPAFIYFALSPLTSKSLPQSIRLVAAALILVLLGHEAWSGWHYQRPYISGYVSAAQRLAEDKRGGIVLYDGDLSANFCFYLRTRDSARRYVVMRKGLYATRNAKIFGAVELVKTPEELQDLLRLYGIRYILVERNAPIEFQIQKTLRELLGTSQFKLLRTFPIESNMSRWRDNLLLYENTAVVSPTAKEFRLKMLTLNHDIVVSMDDLLGR